jgi:hypothetical protein
VNEFTKIINNIQQANLSRFLPVFFASRDPDRIPEAEDLSTAASGNSLRAAGMDGTVTALPP